MVIKKITWVVPLFALLGCPSSNNQATQSAQYRQEYRAIAIGDYGDAFYSISGDKAVDVDTLADGNYIYHPQNLSVVPSTKAKKLYIKLVLDSVETKSQLFSLDTVLNTFEFLSDVAPDSSAWHIGKFNGLQLKISDGTETYSQSFVFEAEELSGDVTKAGFKIWAKWQYAPPPNYNEVYLNVQQVRKVRVY